MSFIRLAALLSLTLTACHATPVPAAPTRTVQQLAIRQAPLAGDWVLHTYIGKKYFADQLHLNADLTGTLTVTGAFTAPLENVHLAGSELSFEILAPEGAKPFRVFYRGQLKEGTMAGFATLEDGSLMAGYVGQRK